VRADLQARREKTAKMAQGFELEAYRDHAKVSLASYKGKIVFLNFFFPG
jgi:hypothetical protein